MTSATYIGKDQNWQDQTTIYWFEMDGETYGIAETGGEDPQPVDFEGYPIDTNEHEAHLVLSACIVSDEMRAE
jgi:hypothetical protein